MKIKTFKGGFDGNFAYLVIDSDRALLIDTSHNEKEILEYCEKENLKLTSVVVMHSHGDHVIGLNEYHKKGIPIIAHESTKLIVDKTVSESDTISVGKINFTVMHTPGYRYDSICLYNSQNKALFTSDTLFVRGCGRVDFEGSDPEKMINTLERLKHLPDDTIIYPGHDYGPTRTSSIKDEKKNNMFLKMSREEFLRNRL